MQNNNSTPAAQPAGQQGDNLRLYNQFRAVPDEAKKAITDGRLKGKTDINPMWRIKLLTEAFGPCGVGWKIEVARQWLENGDADTTAAFVNVNLYIKDPATGAWSDPIPGTGGNVFKRKENSGRFYIDDDCFKKATSDAIGSAAKMLGVGADIYWETDSTKYTSPQPQGSAPTQKPSVRNRPNTGKEVLTPASRFWNQSVAIAMNTTDPLTRIRQRISEKFEISDADFLALMKAAGKVARDATSI